MSDETITVICTGGGAHKRHIFNEITVAPAGLQVKPLRKKNMPDFKGATINGIQVEPYALTPAAYDPRHGRSGWRWKCPFCGLDRQVSADSAVEWAQEWTRGRTLDVSVPPMQ
ncbi:hypothetical protein [Mycolicibacter kumamotonensis]|jgi:hypothetical protein|nr:hypothetical protein [Mycolicibacter kumamotonensis]